MNTTIAGIVFPSDVLTSTWFLVFALAVGFNTLIYIGLTLAKLTPWPRQARARDIRRMAPGLAAASGVPRPRSRPMQVESSDPYINLRRDIARETIPQALALLGGLVLIMSLLSALLAPTGSATHYIVQFFLGVAMIATAQIVVRRRVRAVPAMWTWIVGTTVVTSVLAFEAYRNDNPVALTFAIVLLATLPGVTMAWQPSIVGGAIGVVAVGVSGALVDPDNALRWALAALAAILAGSALLQLRLNAVDSICLERLKANLLATTDPATGLLTQTGLMTLAQGIASVAQRGNEDVCLMAFEVADMDQINADYGFDYGDEVIEAVAQAARATVRDGDLVARWGGARFMVLGIGRKPDPEALRARVTAALNATGVQLGKTPVRIDVSTATGSPATSTLESLVSTAEAELTQARA